MKPVIVYDPNPYPSGMDTPSTQFMEQLTKKYGHDVKRVSRLSEVPQDIGALVVNYYGRHHIELGSALKKEYPVLMRVQDAWVFRQNAGEPGRNIYFFDKNDHEGVLNALEEKLAQSVA